MLKFDTTAKPFVPSKFSAYRGTAPTKLADNSEWLIADFAFNIVEFVDDALPVHTCRV